MWKNIRVVCLLLILVIVSVNAWRDMNQDWNKPITVLLHPINADHQSATEHYIQQISIDDLADIQHYLSVHSKEFRAQPVQFYFQLGRELKKIPPKVPEKSTVLNNIWWSLKFRYYAWQQHASGDGSPSVTLYLNYYDPQQSKRLKHSVALERGRIGTVNLFASRKQNGSNNVVLVHELLHTFGAKDKYDFQTGQPIYPLGYADPEQNPLYPQQRAEIMGGYLPLSASKSVTPESLSDTMISRSTAQEIGWVK
ncbi:hypothetical protein [Acinetobacter sp. ANC 4648]|uniref:hypothetical protein n=1 Tax=Acinetobacter sp. ANC 4648 TaxID=1977875 RepID=UPI000A340012|nr:hypothetical protein [Acinetobacter sp. ANC 4648]OTG85231.1 hypothetical protein B9T27_00710 [Acinetobacter sp. ANC 4648]